MHTLFVSQIIRASYLWGMFVEETKERLLKITIQPFDEIGVLALPAVKVLRLCNITVGTLWSIHRVFGPVECSL